MSLLETCYLGNTIIEVKALQNHYKCFHQQLKVILNQQTEVSDGRKIPVNSKLPSLVNQTPLAFIPHTLTHTHVHIHLNYINSLYTTYEYSISFTNNSSLSLSISLFITIDKTLIFNHHSKIVSVILCVD